MISVGPIAGPFPPRLKGLQNAVPTPLPSRSKTNRRPRMHHLIPTFREQTNIATTDRAGRRKDLGLNVRGHMIFQNCRRDDSDGQWQQSMNIIRRSNDPNLVSSKRSLDHLMSIGLKKNALDNDMIMRHFEHNCTCGTGTGISHVYGSGCVGRSWDGFQRRKPRLGGNLQLPRGEHNDEETIREIRQMLRQTQTLCLDSSPEIDVPKLQRHEGSNNNPSCELRVEVVKIKADGQSGHTKCFGDDPRDAGNEREIENRDKCHNEENLHMEGRDSYYSYTDESSYSVRTTPIHKEVEASKTDIKEDTIIAGIDILQPSSRESKEGKTVENMACYFEGQEKRASLTGGEALVQTRRNEAIFSPTSLDSHMKTKSRHKCEHAGLQLIDKIKNTQQWLAKIRVKSKDESPLLSSSQESLMEENQAKFKEKNRSKGANGDHHRSRLKNAEAHHKYRQSFTRTTMSPCRDKISPKVADKLGGGDCPFKLNKSKITSHFESRHKEESSTR